MGNYSKNELIVKLNEIKSGLGEIDAAINDFNKQAKFAESEKAKLEIEKGKVDKQRQTISYFYQRSKVDIKKERIADRFENKITDKKDKALYLFKQSEFYKYILAAKANIVTAILWYLLVVVVFSIVTLFVPEQLNEVVYKGFLKTDNLYVIYFGYFLAAGAIINFFVSIPRYIKGFKYIHVSKKTKLSNEMEFDEECQKEHEDILNHLEKARKDFDTMVEKYNENVKKYNQIVTSLKAYQTRTQDNIDRIKFNLQRNYDDILTIDDWVDIDEIISLLRSNRAYDIPSALKLVDDRKRHEQMLDKIDKAQREAENYALRQRLAMERSFNEQIDEYNAKIDDYNRSVDLQTDAVNDLNKSVQEVQDALDKLSK